MEVPNVPTVVPFLKPRYVIIREENPRLICTNVSLEALLYRWAATGVGFQQVVSNMVCYASFAVPQTCIVLELGTSTTQLRHSMKNAPAKCKGTPNFETSQPSVLNLAAAFHFQLYFPASLGTLLELLVLSLPRHSFHLIQFLRQTNLPIKALAMFAPPQNVAVLNQQRLHASSCHFIKPSFLGSPLKHDWVVVATYLKDIL